MTSTEIIKAQSVEVDGWKAWDFPDPAADSDGNLWIWQDIKGWFGDLPVRANPIDRPMLDGVYDGPSVFGGRTIEITGKLIAPDRQRLQMGLDKLAGVLASKLRVTDFHVDEAQRSLHRTAMVRLGGPTLITRTGPTSADWSLVLFAADPLRYGVTQRSVGVTPGTEGVGRIYDLTHDRVYGPIGSSGRIQVYNAGNAAMAPTITFFGPSVNPVMQVVGGDRIALMITINQNERVVADCYARTVMLYQQVAPVNGVNRRSAMTSDSRWFTLPSGYTQLYYTVDSGFGTAGVSWRDAWT